MILFFIIIINIIIFSAASPDYATLRAVRTGDASQDANYANAYHVSVDEQKSVRLMRLSGKHASATIYAPLCKVQETPTRDREFTFNDEKLIDPTRSASYRFAVQYNCSTGSDGTKLHASGELGIRTRDSPLWKVWTYAVFASDEIRLGRGHPRNAGHKKWTRDRKIKRSIGDREALLGCHHSFTENICEFDAIIRDKAYVVDFQVDDSHIYLPHSLYMNFTSMHWARGTHIRRVEDWPPLIIETPQQQRIVLDARLFVPLSFEQTLTPPKTKGTDTSRIFLGSTNVVEDEDSHEWASFVSEMLQDSNVLVASDSDRILLGTRVLERYTLERDYIGARMRAVHTPVVDHFTLAQSLFLLFVFTVYIGHKASTMEYIATMILGRWPRCHVCGREITYEICPIHITFASRIVQRTRELILFIIAWFALVFDARLSGNELNSSAAELSVWAYATLIVSTFLFLAITIVEYRCTREWGIYYVRRLFIARSAAFEATSAVAMIALASVVRGGDDFVTGLLVFMAIVVIYDSIRRGFIVFFTFLRSPKVKLNAYLNSMWIAYTIGVTLLLGVIHTTYALARYIIWPFFECGWLFTLVSLGAAIFLSFMVVSVKIRRAMADALLFKQETEQKK